MSHRSFTTMFLDEAAIRRGRETLQTKWGNKVAVLVGDYLHARVLSMLVYRHADDPAMEILADTTQAMCEGEVIHAYKSGDFNISEAEYLKIVSFKRENLSPPPARSAHISERPTHNRLKHLQPTDSKSAPLFKSWMTCSISWKIRRN